MLVNIVMLAVSLLFLLLASDRFVEAVVEFATSLKIPTTVIGLTVVAIGTSLPELGASIAASLRGHPEIAIGNVVGSNICNIGLIIGFPALLSPVVCNPSIIKKEGVVMLLVTAMFWAAAVLAEDFSRPLGVVSVLGFVGYVVWVFIKPRSGDVHKEAKVLAEVAEAEKEIGMFGIVLKMVIALVLIVISSDFLVRGAVGLAEELGISESVIALSIIAFGTSVPELSVSLAAVRRSEGGIIVGNILGSNISNILLVVGSAAVVHPFTISGDALQWDMPVMFVFAAAMLLLLMTKRGVSRLEGLFLLAGYLGYIIVRYNIN